MESTEGSQWILVMWGNPIEPQGLAKDPECRETKETRRKMIDHASIAEKSDIGHKSAEPQRKLPNRQANNSRRSAQPFPGSRNRRRSSTQLKCASISELSSTKTSMKDRKSTWSLSTKWKKRVFRGRDRCANDRPLHQSS
jgi:hypothetical protein